MASSSRTMSQRSRRSHSGRRRCRRAAIVSLGVLGIAAARRDQVRPTAAVHARDDGTGRARPITLAGRCRGTRRRREQLAGELLVLVERVLALDERGDRIRRRRSSSTAPSRHSASSAESSSSVAIDCTNRFLTSIPQASNASYISLPSSSDSPGGGQVDILVRAEVLGLDARPRRDGPAPIASTQRGARHWACSRSIWSSSGSLLSKLSIIASTYGWASSETSTSSPPVASPHRRRRRRTATAIAQPHGGDDRRASVRVIDPPPGRGTSTVASHRARGRGRAPGAEAGGARRRRDPADDGQGPRGHLQRPDEPRRHRRRPGRRSLRRQRGAGDRGAVPRRRPLHVRRTRARRRWPRWRTTSPSSGCATGPESWPVTPWPSPGGWTSTSCSPTRRTTSTTGRGCSHAVGAERVRLVVAEAAGPVEAAAGWEQGRVKRYSRTWVTFLHRGDR